MKRGINIKEFNFNLQSILDVAVDTKNLKLSEFTIAKKVLKSQLELIEEIKNEICKYNTLKSSNIIDLRLIYRYIDILNQKLLLEKHTLLLFEEALKSKETELIEADKKIKILEKLKSNKRKLYEEFINKEENKLLDELGKLSWQYINRNLN